MDKAMTREEKIKKYIVKPKDIRDDYFSEWMDYNLKVITSHYSDDDPQVRIIESLIDRIIDLEKSNDEWRKIVDNGTKRCEDEINRIKDKMREKIVAQSKEIGNLEATTEELMREYQDAARLMHEACTKYEELKKKVKNK